MKAKQKKASSRQREPETCQIEDKRSRDAYLHSNVSSFLARQIKELRGGMSQREFGRLLGKPQSVVSRLEDPDYGKVTLQTLLEIAAKLDVALIVRFATYPTYAKVAGKLASEVLRSADAD
jgi:hypothetical protein